MEISKCSYSSYKFDSISRDINATTGAGLMHDAGYVYSLPEKLKPLPMEF